MEGNAYPIEVDSSGVSAVVLGLFYSIFSGTSEFLKGVKILIIIIEQIGHAEAMTGKRKFLMAVLLEVNRHFPLGEEKDNNFHSVAGMC